MSPARGRESRQQSRLMFILVDGKSEKKYFENFRGINPHLRIEIMSERDQCSYPKSLKYCMSQMTRRQMELDKGDKAVIVTDVDRHTSQDVMDFDKDCTKQGIGLFVSNPSFEVWLVLHFERITRWMSCEELNDELTRILGRRYVKSESIPFDNDRLETAITNGFAQFDDSKNRNEQCLGNDVSRTTLHLLVKEIMDF